MPRKNDPMNTKWFDSEVQKLFAPGKSTFEERQKIVMEWCMGNYQYAEAFAEARDLMPAAVIVGSLVDLEHPLLVEDGKFLCRSLLGASVVVLEVQITHKSVHIPLWITCVQPVYKSPETVDKSGEIPS